jgi:ABC-type transporter Mla MlaB component
MDEASRPKVTLSEPDALGNRTLTFSGWVDESIMMDQNDLFRTAMSDAATLYIQFEKDCAATSTLVGILVRLDTHRKNMGKPVILRGVPPKILKLLAVVNLDKSFTIQ